ncbi:MAG: MlaD family protein [Longimicrobiales bacterium]
MARATSNEIETAAPSDDLDRLVIGRTARREVLVGAFALAGLLAILIALFTMTDAATFRGRYIVTAVVDNAGGLRRGDPVQMRGVNIGRVQTFDIGTDAVAVRLELDGEYEVPADSRLVLESGGLLGGRIANIIPGIATEPLEQGDVLRGSIATGLTEATASISQGAERALMQINALLSEPTVDAFGRSAIDLQQTLAQLSGLITEQRRELVALSASLRRTAIQIEAATGEGELQALIGRLDVLTQGADEATTALGRASASIELVVGRLERGEGTLGLLSRDDQLYNNLNEAAVSVRMLAQDIRQNPDRYFNVRVF